MRSFFTAAAFFIMSSSAMAADMYGSPVPSAAPSSLQMVKTSKVPACDNPFILRDLRRQFGQKERQYWSSTLEIDGFSMIRETAFRPWKNALIERRFCEADVLLSNAHSSKAYYSIAYRTGLGGTNFGIEICVKDVDRNMAYAPNCRMAHP